MDAVGYDDIKELVTYFAKGGEIEPLLVKKAIQILGGYNQERRGKIIDYLVENHPKRFGLDVPTIKAAIKEAGVETARVWIDAKEVHCDACGQKFKFAPYVTDDDEIDRSIHSRCPQCNFDYTWTEEAHDKMRRTGARPDNPPDWYERMRKHYGEKYGLGNPPVFNRQQAELWRTQNAAKF